MLNALSIDVEDYFQVHALAKAVRRSDWEAYPSRVVANTRRILAILREHGCHATFFIIGWVADRFPSLVTEIAAEGHEIGTHGYWHELVYRQTPQEFAADVTRSLQAIHSALAAGADVTRDTPVLGYRAPSFSIVQSSLWALDVLRDLGLRYDSSIFPLAAHDRYGIRNAERFAHRLGNGLWELPVSTVRLFNRNWPIAGGGYFRLFPYWITRRGIQHINAEGHPSVVYLHPWEVDPEQPRIRGVGVLSSFRHYVNLDKTEERLHRLLEEFEFGPMAQVFEVA